MAYFPPAGGGVVLPNSIDNTLISDMAAATVKGRAAGAGAGDPQDLSVTQLWALLGNPVFTQCRLVAVGDNSRVRLERCNGYLLTIDSKPEVIPAAGVLLTMPATASTLYYVYAYVNAGVMTLTANPTAPAIDPRNGLSVVTGDPSWTLVGLAYVNSSNVVRDDTGARCVLSFYNRRSLLMGAVMSALVATSTTPVPWAAGTFDWLTWGDELVLFSVTGNATQNTANQWTFTGCQIDSADAGGGVTTFTTNAGWPYNCAVVQQLVSARGKHSSSPLFAVSAGTGTWTGTHYVTTRG